jgi:hypothetical protein
MGVNAITPAEAVEQTVEVLGLDPGSVDLTSLEVLAASVRRAASFLCPVTPGLLVRSIDDALARLPGHSVETRLLLEATLDALVLYGDLLELPVDDESGPRRHLFLGPPAFIHRQSEMVLLLGVRPEGAPLLSDTLSEGIENDAHVRRLRLGPHLGKDALLDDGLIEVQPEQWLRCPPAKSAGELVADHTARILATGDAGPLEGIRVLDPSRPSTFYRGRWRELTPADTGIFVARRPQGYGADLWSFVEVGGGEVRRGIDLPVQEPLAPGADEAWRLQAAIDADNDNPQRVAVRAANREGWSVLDLFSPIPSWAQRRLDVVGTPILRSRGALLSYAVPTAEVDEEVQFLETMMWLSSSADEEHSGG